MKFKQQPESNTTKWNGWNSHFIRNRQPLNVVLSSARGNQTLIPAENSEQRSQDTSKVSQLKGIIEIVISLRSNNNLNAIRFFLLFNTINKKIYQQIWRDWQF